MLKESTTNTTAKKTIIKAEDLVFKVVEKNFISNIDDSEQVYYSDLISKINDVVELFEIFSKKEFSLNESETFNRKLTDYFRYFDNLVTDIENPKIVMKFKKIFRGKTHRYLTESHIASRALTKPFGYPGDYIMMQYLYDDVPVSPTSIGKYLDQYFLNDPLANAVKGRVNKMAEKVIQFIDESKKNSLHILNIASGPGYDLLNISKYYPSKDVTIHCFDQEIDSLTYVKNRLKNVNSSIEFKFYKEDIKTFFKKWNGGIEFDYVYNIGLADYLPDRILKNLIQEGIKSLSDSGKFVIAHKDYLNFPDYIPDWLVDWNFINRSFQDCQAFITNNITGYSTLNHFFESNHKIVYFNEFMK